ncbi:hypothetical protein HMI56_007271 [Coelomomyces lativittatus]|nr:hypothetical protein HMI56_007271 [Coelomomyces lativittatus]
MMCVPQRFVEFYDSRTAVKAFNAINNQSHFGVRLSLEYAWDKSTKQSMYLGIKSREREHHFRKGSGGSQAIPPHHQHHPEHQFQPPPSAHHLTSSGRGWHSGPPPSSRFKDMPSFSSNYHHHPPRDRSEKDRERERERDFEHEARFRHSSSFHKMGRSSKDYEHPPMPPTLSPPSFAKPHSGGGTMQHAFRERLPPRYDPRNQVDTRASSSRERDHHHYYHHPRDRPERSDRDGRDRPSLSQRHDDKPKVRSSSSSSGSSSSSTSSSSSSSHVSAYDPHKSMRGTTSNHPNLTLPHPPHSHPSQHQSHVPQNLHAIPQPQPQPPLPSYPTSYAPPSRLSHPATMAPTYPSYYPNMHQPSAGYPPPPPPTTSMVPTSQETPHGQVSAEQAQRMLLAATSQFQPSNTYPTTANPAAANYVYATPTTSQGNPNLMAAPQHMGNASNSTAISSNLASSLSMLSSMFQTSTTAPPPAPSTYPHTTNQHHAPPPPPPQSSTVAAQDALNQLTALFQSYQQQQQQPQQQPPPQPQQQQQQQPQQQQQQQQQQHINPAYAMPSSSTSEPSYQYAHYAQYLAQLQYSNNQHPSSANHQHKK